MELHQVRYFLSVVEHRNFTHAARHLSISQPTLTRAIQRLEHELRSPLLIRQRGDVHPTEFGRVLLPSLRAVVDLVSLVERCADHFLRGQADSMTRIVIELAAES